VVDGACVLVVAANQLARESNPRTKLLFRSATAAVQASKPGAPPPNTDAKTNDEENVFYLSVETHPR
jgi:hypothetical protein